MGFLDYEPEFDGSMFNRDDLLKARETLIRVFNLVDNKWISKPRGQLSSYWNADAYHPSLFLINLAYMITRTEDNIDKPSRPRLLSKIGELLRSKNDKSFNEILSELQVAEMLSYHSTKVTIEPFVPFDLYNSPKEPSSPDFSLQMMGTKVVVEATTMRVDILDNLTALKSVIRRRLEKSTLGVSDKYKIRHRVTVIVPIALKANDVIQKQIDKLALRIASTESGQEELRFGVHTVGFKWEPQVFEGDEGHPYMVIEGRLVVGPVKKLTFALATFFEIRKEDVDTVSEACYKSLRNTLNNKRDQAKLIETTAPYIIALTLPQEYIKSNVDVLRMVVDRIWPNPDYKWLSMLLLYLPISSFQEGEEGKAIYSHNPNAEKVIPPETLDAMNTLFYR